MLFPPSLENSRKQRSPIGRREVNGFHKSMSLVDIAMPTDGVSGSRFPMVQKGAVDFRACVH